MSKITMTLTIPPVTGVCSSALTTAMTVASVSIFMGLGTALGKHDVVLPPPQILKDTLRGIVTTVLQ